MGPVSQTPWHPQGVLTAHLAEHRQGVNQLAVAGNGMFFASASNDETVKVWDSRRLEKDVSFKSRLTYTAQGECRGQVSRPCREAQTYLRLIHVHMHCQDLSWLMVLLHRAVACHVLLQHPANRTA